MPHEMALRSGDGIPDVLVVDHDPKFTSALFKELTLRIGSSLSGDLTPFFIDRGQHPRLPLPLPDLRAAGEPPAAYATRRRPWSRRC